MRKSYAFSLISSILAVSVVSFQLGLKPVSQINKKLALLSSTDSNNLVDVNGANSVDATFPLVDVNSLISLSDSSSTSPVDTTTNLSSNPAEANLTSESETLDITHQENQIPDTPLVNTNAGEGPQAAVAVVIKDLKLAALGPAYPDDTSYMMCSGCKAAYLITEEGLGKRSLRVRCFVCEKEWFQTTERLLKTDNQHHLQNMTDDKIAEVRRSQQAITWQTRQSSRLDKVGVFVGNLPYTFDEKEITDLFGDYGLTGLSLVRDGDGQSKGFAFLEVSNQEDANNMINEMHHFFTDASRRLTVRLTETQASGRGGAGRGDGGRGGEGRGRGDGAGRGDGGRGAGGYEDRGGRGAGRGSFDSGGGASAGRSFSPRGGGGGRSAGRGGGRSSGGRGRSSY